MEPGNQNNNVHLNRPKVTIMIPQYSPQSPYLSPYIASNISGSNTPGQPNWPQVVNNPFYNHFQPQKAREMFFKQLNEFRGLAKSGLSFGEKTALWIYEKFSVWSKKWFTHLFLIIVMMLYSFVGGLLFMNIEGKIYFDSPRGKFFILKLKCALITLR